MELETFITKANRVLRMGGGQRSVTYSGKIYFVRRSAERYKILVHSEIRVDKDFCLEVGNTLSRLVPYSVDAKRGGQKAFLKKGKLVMN